MGSYKEFCNHIIGNVEQRFRSSVPRSISLLEVDSIIKNGYMLSVDKVLDSLFIIPLQSNPIYSSATLARYDKENKRISRDERALQSFFEKYRQDFECCATEELRIKGLEKLLEDKLWEVTVESTRYTFGG